MRRRLRIAYKGAPRLLTPRRQLFSAVDCQAAWLRAAPSPQLQRRRQRRPRQQSAPHGAGGRSGGGLRAAAFMAAQERPSARGWYRLPAGSHTVKPCYTLL
mmetsp:Transcript_38800/g.97476  ORF Transcript_38800/g.97476 Transcript_38800/m.97476 type:complete len:101 (+) Transcript_38800:220-522(+)